MPINITEELDRYRKKLLDTSKRNRLINYRKSRARTIQIVDEHPDQIFTHLVAGRSFRFDPWQEDELSQSGLDRPKFELPEVPTGEPARRHRDSRLQTISMMIHSRAD